MRAQVFVPGHVSCTFRPFKGKDIDSTGSLGFGIRLSLGCRASAELRDDDQIIIRMNGKPSEAEVTRSALESMFPGRGMEVDLEHDLPLEQGFGSSASGTYAATLAVASLLGKDPSLAAAESHRAECSRGGGLGDLLAIDSGYGVPIRTAPGAPGICGRTEDSGLNIDNILLGVFDSPLRTGSVLSDEDKMNVIIRAGDRAVADFSKDRTMKNLYETSNRFSKEIGLESEEVSWALKELKDRGFSAGMCMLGNSIYTDAPMDVLKDTMPEARLFTASSYSGKITVTRTE